MQKKGKTKVTRHKKLNDISPSTDKNSDESLIVFQIKDAIKEALETVAKMPYPGVGLRTIAGILRGEMRANWLSFIARTESWGSFFPNQLVVVEGFLRELVKKGYLEGIHFTRLTERGQQLLNDEQILYYEQALDGEGAPAIHKRIKLISTKARPFLWKLLLLRASLVNQGKAPGSLKDEAILEILRTKPQNLDELKKLKGIGSFIVNHIGRQIVGVFNNSGEKSN